jgi:serine/threonine-protein kinase
MEEIAFGRYRLLQQLGAGGMAVVWRAVIDGPEGFAREVVIKRVLPELGRSDEFVRMLLGEARLSARLRHPGIVQVHELGQVDGEYFLAMEYVEGSDLVTIAEKCRDRQMPLPIGLACFIAREVAAALAYAHELKDDEGRPLCVVHRDVSPSNVMVSSAGVVKLLDFGIAKAADHFRRERTQTGVLKGKLSYLSPEQAEGEELDPRSDLFALGIVLHECLTNRRLFSGGDELKTLRLVREAAVSQPSAARPEVPPELDAVVAKMLARRREDRYANGHEIVEALAPFVHRFEGNAVRLRSFARELTGGSAGAPRAAVSTTTRRALEPTTGASTSGELEARDDDPLDDEEVEGQSHSPWVMAVMGAVAAIGVAVIATNFRGLYGQPAPSVPTPAALPAAPPAPPPPVAASPAREASAPVPSNVRLQIAGSKDAAVTLDGRPLGRVPLDVVIARDLGPHRLEIAHAGAETVARTIVADRDQTLEIVLPRVHVTHASAPRATPAAKAPPRASGGEIEDPFAN